MNADTFITITGIGSYFGTTPFRPGGLVRCCKEPSNAFDAEAICCSLPGVGTVGYVANSVRTVVRGCSSAGRVYDSVADRFHARVLFVLDKCAIARVETLPPDQCERELMEQLSGTEWSSLHTDGFWDCFTSSHTPNK